MKATQLLHNLGQSLWLDNHYTRLAEHRHTETLYRRAVGDGLTSNPTIFDHAIKNSSSYDRCDPQET
jgi:transaldolase